MRSMIGEHHIVNSVIRDSLSKNLQSLENYAEIWLSFAGDDPSVVILLHEPVLARILNSKVFIVSVEESVVTSICDLREPYLAARPLVITNCGCVD